MNTNNLSLTGDSVIRMSTDDYKRIEDILVGDYVRSWCLRTNALKKSYVSAIVKCKCLNNLASVVKLSNKCNISPYHPVIKELINGGWKYPINLGEIKNINCNFLYNIVLEPDSHAFILDNDYLAISLGHKLTDNIIDNNNILYHPFYSTDKVLDCIKNLPDYPYVKIDPTMIHRNPDNDLVYNIQ